MPYLALRLLAKCRQVFLQYAIRSSYSKLATASDAHITMSQREFELLMKHCGLLSTQRDRVHATEVFVRSNWDIDEEQVGASCALKCCGVLRFPDGGTIPLHRLAMVTDRCTLASSSSAWAASPTCATAKRRRTCATRSCGC